MQKELNGKLIMLLVFGALIASAVAGAVTPTDYDEQNLTSGRMRQIFLRNRRLSAVSSQTVPCVSRADNKCECPGSCMVPTNDTSPICKLNKCYGWDTNLGKCVETGPKFTPALVLQAIPFTGVFGSGFGNMGRWDIFGVYMAVCFGPLGVLLIACCCMMMGAGSQDENQLDCCKCLSSCFGCLWSVAILVFWIWGIVVIANKETLGPHGCPLK